MTLKRIGMAGKLGFAGVIACGICLVPLGVPIVAGLIGGGALAAGQWIAGAAVIGALLFVVPWKKMRRTGQPGVAKSEDVPECCGKRA